MVQRLSARRHTPLKPIVHPKWRLHGWLERMPVTGMQYIMAQ